MAVTAASAERFESARTASRGDTSAEVRKLRRQVQRLNRRVATLSRVVARVAKPAGPGAPGPTGPPGPASGPAGGDLAGNYPSPTIATGAVGSAKVADGSLLGADLAPDAVGPLAILDPTRSIHLPLRSFVGRTATVDFGPDDGSGVNLARVGEPGQGLLALEWDDDADELGSDVADTEMVSSTFVVPPDYASEGSFAIYASKDGNAPAIELLNCEVSVLGFQFGAWTSALVPVTFVNRYVLTPASSFFSGAPVELRCWVDNTNHNNTFDDVVWVHSVAFDYKAAQ
jgi:hypothetical protein